MTYDDNAVVSDQALREAMTEAVNDVAKAIRELHEIHDEHLTAIRDELSEANSTLDDLDANISSFSL